MALQGKALLDYYNANAEPAMTPEQQLSTANQIYDKNFRNWARSIKKRLTMDDVLRLQGEGIIKDATKFYDQQDNIKTPGQIEDAYNRGIIGDVNGFYNTIGLKPEPEVQKLIDSGVIKDVRKYMAATNNSVLGSAEDAKKLYEQGIISDPYAYVKASENVPKEFKTRLAARPIASQSSNISDKGISTPTDASNAAQGSASPFVPVQDPGEAVGVRQPQANDTYDKEGNLIPAPLPKDAAGNVQIYVQTNPADFAPKPTGDLFGDSTNSDTNAQAAPEASAQAAPSNAPVGDPNDITSFLDSGDLKAVGAGEGQPSGQSVQQGPQGDNSTIGRSLGLTGSMDFGTNDFSLGKPSDYINNNLDPSQISAPLSAITGFNKQIAVLPDAIGKLVARGFDKLGITDTAEAKYNAYKTNQASQADMAFNANPKSYDFGAAAGVTATGLGISQIPSLAARATTLAGKIAGGAADTIVNAGIGGLFGYSGANTTAKDAAIGAGLGAVAGAVPAAINTARALRQGRQAAKIVNNPADFIEQNAGQILGQPKGTTLSSINQKGKDLYKGVVSSGQGKNIDKTDLYVTISDLKNKYSGGASPKITNAIQAGERLIGKGANLDKPQTVETAISNLQSFRESAYSREFDKGISDQIKNSFIKTISEADPVVGQQLKQAETYYAQTAAPAKQISKLIKGPNQDFNTIMQKINARLKRENISKAEQDAMQVLHDVLKASESRAASASLTGAKSRLGTAGNVIGAIAGGAGAVLSSSPLGLTFIAAQQALSRGSNWFEAAQILKSNKEALALLNGGILNQSTLGILANRATALLAAKQAQSEFNQRGNE